MKNSKLVTSLFYAILFAFCIAILFASVTSIPTVVYFSVIMAFSLFAGATKYNQGALRDGVYVEAWIGELVKKFRFKREWLNRIPRYDQHVKNKVIHLVDIGADPNVFIDLVIDSANPVPTALRTDTDIPITLDRYDTENTRISLTELRAISYDKMAVTLDLHMNAISDKAAIKAAHRLAATAQANIKKCTGASDGRAVPKNRITPDDLTMMMEIVSTPVDQGGPGWNQDAGIAVLDFRHVADLQKLDQTFDKKWRNTETGKLFDYNGWLIEKYTQNARYTKVVADYNLKAFGSAYDAANDLHSSMFFLPERSFAAADSAPEMFYRMATNDPELRSNTVGFRHWSVIAKKKADGFYQLVSDKI